MGRREQLTVRQILGRLASGTGHWTVVGSYEQIADVLEDWFASGAADGFNLMPPVLPSSMRQFIDGVVPILQARGLFRVEYDGVMLREHYGLERPANTLTAASAG
ncbi:LLM class oxidoreductase [Capillimicrobium parvum]|uniref:Nitrilotriacetate monooxygenase component A n=1 Tax=Capillimicrobium parvum TaxID=2884022 RepID=A0A9E6Y0D9_9ACTN|nr:hypothetical protein [Capillimicrobium parvum]UGS37327.1 Nitrilotriacetate monooxygenase component A [Capillimicrobium parvum]